jgi:cyclophilin family peptidyl-prolyl cis-trans isomerase/HEAT repeat protein
MAPGARREVVLALACSTALVTVLAAGAQRAGQFSDRDYITGTPQGVAILAAEDSRAPTPTELATLVEGTRSAVRELKLAAVRALGRLERRDVVSALLPLAGDKDAEVRTTAAHAIGQAMQGEPLPGDAGAQQVDAVQSAIMTLVRSDREPDVAAALATTLARLPYDRSDQIQRAETQIRALLTLSSELAIDRSSERAQTAAISGAARAFDTLARRQRTLFSPAEDTAAALKGIASGGGRTIGSAAAMRAARPWAYRAVVSVRRLDAETLRPNLTADWDAMLRQQAMLSLAGAGSPISGEEQVRLLRQGLADPSYFVRFEAVRGYARHGVKADGCGPLAAMLSDPSEHVVLAAIDALGDACAADSGIVVPRLIAEARTPAEQGAWRRESRALVALAKRSPDDTAIPLATHARHNRWQVRTYAARAAAIVGDTATLERLAQDDHDNVREATLGPLKKLKGYQVEPFLIAALGRSDYQLLRTAARELAGLPASAAVAEALLGTLVRVTGERRETSRDTRLALIERLREFGSDTHLERLRPLLRDFDPKVAAAAAAVMTAWSGQAFTPEPQPLPREPLPQPSELKLVGENVLVLALDTGRELVVQLDPVTAPMTSVRILRLVNRNYFDGLTFHRVVSNFVIQGGSPGANEYMGDGPFLRDEISSSSHNRGTVGLSTRGRDTGDAQLFVNLVNNPRLDFDYTIVGRVSARSLGVLDEILEGDRINDAWFEPAGARR